MKKIFLMLVVLFSSVFVQAQVQQAWVARANGIENKNEVGGHIAMDAAGNIYVAGSRGGSANKGDDGFLTIKYNSKTGAVIWAHINDGAGNGSAGPSDMCVDAAGNVYVTGGGGPTSHGTEWYTIKYNTNGDQQWEDAYTNSAAGEQPSAIAVDANGNVFVTGYSYSDDGVRSIATIKYNASGSRVWVKYYNGDDNDGGAIGVDIAVDADGNVYVTGYASYTGTGHDLVILKYDNNGTQLSSNRYDGPQNDEPVSMVLDADANIYIAAKSGVLNHGLDFLTLKYNSNCSIIWERLFNGPTDNNDQPAEIAVDGSGNVFVGGFTTFKIVNGLFPFRNYLLIKYDVNGNKLWNVSYDSGEDIDDDAIGVALDAIGDVYITGFSGSVSSSNPLANYVTIKYNTNGVQQWLKAYDGTAGGADTPEDILVDLNKNVYVSGSSPGASTLYDIATIKYSQCEIVCPSNITVNNDAGKCSAVVNFNPATYTGDCGSSFTYSHNSGIEFPVGVTTVTVTSDETGASCSFTITVVDNEKPVITNCPSSKSVNTGTGVCYATAASVNAGTATATDNCSVTVAGIRSDGLSLTANYSVGVTTINWTATDASGNTATCSQMITVVDNIPPTITGESASTYVLSPPNHSMRDVVINYTATDNCAVTSVITVTSNEPINGVGDGDTDPDWIVVDIHNVKLRAERSAAGSGRIYTVTITATDPSGNTAVKTIEVRVPHDIKNPNSGKAFILGSTVNFEGEFWDRANNKHTAKWLIDDNTTVKAAVVEPSGTKNGKVTGSYKFTSAGVYKLQMSVTDQNGITHYTNTNGDIEEIVVVYDPNGGYAYGGGWFASPKGAFTNDRNASGKVSFGFASNYFKNATYPKGETQMEFKVGNLEFNALNYEYLVINSAKAQFRGTGKIVGGQSGIGFIMTVMDGQINGSTDKIRLKLFNKTTGAVIYDNQPGASDAADPTATVGDGSTIFITSASATTQARIAAGANSEELFNVNVYPNPSASDFMINITTNKLQPAVITITNSIGQVVKILKTSSKNIRLGEDFKPGVYIVEIKQGENNQTIELIKY